MKREELSASTKPDNVKYHHGNLKQALLDNALSIIEGNGLDALSLRKLAATIGVNQTALYSHFKNKNELMKDLARHGFSQLSQSMNTQLEKTPSAERALLELANVYLLFAQHNPELFKLMFSPEFTELHKNDDDLWKTSEESFHIYEAVIGDYLSLKGSKANPKLASLAAWSFIHGFCHLIIGDRLSQDTLILLNNGHLLEGLIGVIQCGLDN